MKVFQRLAHAFKAEGVDATFGMHAIEAAHHVTVDHGDHRFGQGVVHPLEGGDAFLHDEFGDLRLAGRQAGQAARVLRGRK